MKKLLIIVSIFFVTDLGAMEKDKAQKAEDEKLLQTTYGQRVKEMGWDQQRQEIKFWLASKQTKREKAIKTLVIAGLGTSYWCEFFKSKCSLLALAAKEDNRELITFLLDHKALINEKLGRGETPLFHAKSVSAVELLVSRGADIKACDERGETFLDHMIHLVSEKNTISPEEQALLKYLIGKQEINSKVGKMALVKLAYRPVLTESHLECAKIFLEAGVDLDATDWEGKTAETIVQNKINKREPSYYERILLLAAIQKERIRRKGTK